MDRYWFLTWRTYGTWLPGADGFVGYYRNPDRVTDNAHGQPKAEPIAPLKRYAREVMRGPAVVLGTAHAETLLKQFQETATHRGWALDAVAVMPDHVHIVFGVPGDPDPSELLKTLKSYASRSLSRLAAVSGAPRWFADGGSKRRLKAEANRIGAICYTRDQDRPLLVWLSAEATALVIHHPAPSVAGSPEPKT